MGGKLAVIASLFVPLWMAQAEETLPVLKANGVTYTNVTITKVSATDIFFTSSNGMGNVKLKGLDRKTQKHFHYDAGKAKAAEHQQAENAVQYHQKLLHDYPQPGTGQTNYPVSDANKRIWAKSYLNQQGPELFVEKWLTPMPDCRGKSILYVFWATTSEASRAEIPELNEFQREFSDKLVIIGMSAESEEVVRPVADPAVQYFVAIDTQGRTKNAVGVAGLPHLMFIDPSGIVRWEGYPFLTGHEFGNKVLTDLLAEFGK